jgi:hypothetical protein
MSDGKLKSAPLAYENPSFLNSPDGRILRLLAEYTEPLSRFRREQIQDTVVFFGSARFHSHADANRNLTELEKGLGVQHPEERKKALALVDMARYYEDARRLAFLLTQWSIQIPARRRRFVVTTGGGPGIMEAANLGAQEAGGKTIGLNINLPFEQNPNPYITPALNFEFHYFFMRKFWFAYLAKALVVFPGGFGTMDELFEILTLVQTQKLAKKITIILYGTSFWKEVVNFDALVKYGTIAASDMDLFQFADSPETAMALLRQALEDQATASEAEIPAISPSAKPDERNGNAS